jgi:RNA polymerase sigma-70 factor (ECF subfamily)
MSLHPQSSPLASRSRDPGETEPPLDEMEEALESGVHSASPPELDFSAVYTRYFHEVCRWVTAFGCASSEIEDVAQEVFLVARRRLAQVAPTNLGGWLYRTTYNVASEYRRRRWFKSFFKRSERDLELVAPASDCPSAQLERKEAQRLFEAALGRMTPKRRAVFYLFEIEGYSGQELATLEGVALKTIYTRLHHARREFLAACAQQTERP